MHTPSLSWMKEHILKTLFRILARFLNVLFGVIAIPLLSLRTINFV